MTCLLSSFFTFWDGGYVSVAQAALKLNKGWPWTHSLGLSSLELTVTFLSAGMTWSWTLNLQVHRSPWHLPFAQPHHQLLSFHWKQKARALTRRREFALPEKLGPGLWAVSASTVRFWELLSLVPSLTCVFHLENYMVWIILSRTFTGNDSFVLIMAHFRNWRKWICLPCRKESTEGNTRNLPIVLRPTEILQYQKKSLRSHLDIL